MPLEDIDNIVIPSSSGATTCGYCSPPGQRSESATSYHTATLEAIRLTCAAYQDMIDRGWRRSGTYCYKPNLEVSCCPQYTIRLDATAFKPSRSQRKLLNRWNRFVLLGESDPNAMEVEQATSAITRKANSKPNKSTFTSLAASIHESEFTFQADKNPSHKFEVILEPASYTAKKFDLYKRYQAEIHNDKRNNPSGFKRFLTEPIPYTSPPPDHLPLNYGSYHQIYKLDGELIAMGVIDILPKCVSSVYFMYDKTWERFSLGKLSALREASLANEMLEAGAPGMGKLYMGFYIYSCQKMRYKGDYAPSYLADPETYEWFPLENCIPLLEKYKYACFSNPIRSCNHDDGESRCLFLSDYII
ncbi:arginine-tRNA-protein transferase [Gymnopilus junonius]|uniref:Arginyl-tRNA--protein transferase 1 n=1 Tax=Gymnopilus junonius TaxID=109634 RepID=A0A9P5TVL4_GYMJU|nr:arginine-tRNA-protein transferase [Gymnopilus junonius]